MDYKEFFSDVLEWIRQANQAASKYGMHTEQFWIWVADSTAAICRKYNDNQLAIKQMIMLIEWLEDAYKKQQEADTA